MPSDDASSEGKFVARLRRRDESAFNQLVIQHEARVYQLAWRILGNRAEAEDMTQEVFVQVFRSIESFRGDSKLSTWIFRLTINLTKNRLKYLSRRRTNHHADLEQSQDQALLGASGVTSGEHSRPDLDLFATETERIVVLSLHRLEPEYRNVLVLRDIEGLSYDEISLILELPPGTVKSRLHRARSDLRRFVEEARGEPLI